MPQLPTHPPSGWRHLVAFWRQFLKGVREVAWVHLRGVHSLIAVARYSGWCFLKITSAVSTEASRAFWVVVVFDRRPNRPLNHIISIGTIYIGAAFPYNSTVRIVTLTIPSKLSQRKKKNIRSGEQSRVSMSPNNRGRTK
jgi:hypothetical protein